MRNSFLRSSFLAMIVLSFGNGLLCTVQPKLQEPDNPSIRYTGRIDFTNPKEPRLSSAGATIEISFRGTSCEVMLRDQNLWGNHNYFTAVLDGQYLGRYKVYKDSTRYPIARRLQDAVHRLVFCKATESQIGYLDFLGVICGEILPYKAVQTRRIEFIGNSITCGTGLEKEEVPCGQGAWYDQQNAWLTYGPLIAREFNADWLLSGVSGIGITRNWNSPGPVMSDVYAHLFLNADSASPWNAGAFVPDLISVCLGTNDFSNGDGSYERGPLDSAEFVNKYVRFIQTIRSRYPHATICCLASPILDPGKNAKLKAYLSEAVRRMREDERDSGVHSFAFSRQFNHGCTGHPDKQDHRLMADELIPFFKKVMNWE